MGRFPKGSKLPSKRVTALKNDVSVITVEHAYELLVEEGYVISKEKSGFFVLYDVDELFYNPKSGAEGILEGILSNEEDTSYFGKTKTKSHDTEFGGKTGTSNNHSDAWFMGVSPKLVVGAWVGGEYRSIHFRTGALGQGSRTALPICGYFFESVLGDPAFQKYHARFEKPKDEDITPDMYNCQNYYRARPDTTYTDSLSYEEELILDDNGAPIQQENIDEPVENAATEEPDEFI